MSEITPKQQVVLTELKKLEAEGLSPTVRSLTDRLETKRHRAERFSDAEVRGLLERLEAGGYVEQFTGTDSAQRYCLAPSDDIDTPA